MMDAFVVAVGMAVIASVMAAVIILLRAALKNRHGVSRRAFVFLWMLVFLRACIPFGFDIGSDGAESPLPGFVIYDTVYEQVYEGQWAGAALTEDENALQGVAAENTIESEAADSFSALNSSCSAETIVKIILAVWAFGTVSAGGFFACSYIRKIREIKKSDFTEPDSETIKIFEAAKEKTGVKKAVLKQGKTGGSAVYGIMNPIVVFENNNASDTEIIMIHELVHVKHKDNLKKVFAFGVLALHWFNPLMWGAVKLMIRDIEMACDEKVLKIIGREEKKDYAGLILNSARVSSGNAALSFFGESPASERIKHILLIKKKQIASPLICTALAAFMLFGCFVSPVSAVQDKITSVLDAGIESSFKKFDVPNTQRYPVTDYGMFRDGAVFLQEKTDLGVYTFNIMDSSGKSESYIDVPISEGEYNGSVYCDDTYIYYGTVKGEREYINRLNRNTGAAESIVSSVSDNSGFELFGGNGYLCWYEGQFLKVMNLNTGLIEGVYETCGNQNYGAVLRGWTAYSYKDENSGKYMVRSVDLAGKGFYEAESLLGAETYSVYGNDRYIIYKEDFNKAQVYVFDRETGMTSSLWDLIPEETANTLSMKPWGISLLEDSIIICGEGSQVYVVDLKSGSCDEIVSETKGIGYFSYKNSGKTVSTMLYVRGENDPEATGNIYVASIVDKAAK